jgi:branched-chain amino acid transport system substrate-binding protein
MTQTSGRKMGIVGGKCGAAVVALVGFMLPLGPATAQDFKMGVVASISGPAASLGKDMVDGVNAWVKWFNAKGGFNGKPVAVEILDDETNPVNAVNAFRRLAADPSIKFVCLAQPSSTALAIKPLATELALPVVSGGAVDALGIPAGRFFFKMAPTGRDFIIVLADYALAKGYKRIATINATDAYGQDEARHLKEAAAARGLTVVAAESFQTSDTSFTAQLAKVKAANPDFVYSAATGGPAIQIFRTYKQLGIGAPLAMSQAALAKPLFDAVGGPAAVDGVMTPTQLGTFGEASGGEHARLFGELQGALGRRPLFLNALGWDCGIIGMAAALKSDGTRNGIRDALENLKDFAATNGLISYKPDNHTGTDKRSVKMAVFRNQKFELAK